jgi:hypothetical protein
MIQQIPDAVKFRMPFGFRFTLTKWSASIARVQPLARE